MTTEPATDPTSHVDDVADAFLEALGETVRARRREISMTQAELASRAGCSEYQIRLVEQGKANPTIRLTIAICFALKSTPADLFPR